MKREDFPFLKTQFFGHPLAYLDNGATSQKPQCVIDAINLWYTQGYANVHRGAYTLSENTTNAYEGTRVKVQKFINAKSSDEIIYVKGTTEGINLVAHSFGNFKLKSGDEIVISAIEHHSNIVPWQLVAEKTGAKLKVIPVNDAGELIQSEYEKLLNPKTKIVAITHVSNALGTINPVKEMSRKAHEVGAVVLVDGAQSIPHMKVDVQDLDCDFYVFSGHKVYAPTGIGILYGKKSLLNAMPPYQGGGDMIRSVTFEKTTYNDLPYKFEAGTPTIVPAIGLGVAVDYLQNVGLDSIAAYENKLLEYATDEFKKIPQLKIVGTAQNKASLISFVLEKIHPHDIATILDREGIAIRAGHHCAQPVMERMKIPATARASFAFYNTTEEIDRLVVGIKKVIKMFH